MGKQKLKSVLGAVAASLDNHPAAPASVDVGAESAGSISRFSATRVIDAMSRNIDSVTTYEVPPERCRPWGYHNRMYSLLNEASCATLIESIRTHGQREPAKVRRIKEDAQCDFEVIAGARRLWVAHYLKISYKIEVMDLSDEDAFVLSDDSNKQQDVSSYERAVEYRKVLVDIFGGNQARMAARINLSESRLSRLLALAALPPEMIDCVPDPRDLTVEQAEKLRIAMKGSESTRRVLDCAMELSRAKQRGDEPLTTAAVVKILLASINPKTRKRHPAEEEIIGRGGKPLFHAVRHRTKIVFTLPLAVAQSHGDEAGEAVTRYLKNIATRNIGVTR